MKTTKYKQVRIDQDVYEALSEYADSSEGYVSTTQLINQMLRQAIRAARSAAPVDKV